MKYLISYSTGLKKILTPKFNTDKHLVFLFMKTFWMYYLTNIILLVYSMQQLVLCLHGHTDIKDLNPQSLHTLSILVILVIHISLQYGTV